MQQTENKPFDIFKIDTIGNEILIGRYHNQAIANRWFKYYIEKYGVGHVTIRND